MFNAQLAVLLPMVASAIAICPGFNFGIGNVIRLDSGMNRWNVYNSDCVVVDGLTTTQNPCNSGTFGCTPAPIIFNRYTSKFNGLTYECGPDGGSGQCGSDVISVCCRQ
ncbi:hypothetical protein CC1G_08428 [Coprinopsis cinerea okayama7|uniref:Uncharacterized protein n=1 Tax=Coprinopsis cinerea (strain Okayama-7 / 130 / ATCC MYA-4618 / FGSC 9003) TaxID=240176 RepID=A8NAQ9_COPC7|nr:hypothetical protein CC1G_08428 [Coprinopsis cinerea okayama7\|eukprot:XP_001831911.1 hypothetical protein CC1G_08428 [Coprinopsis cinerea okayama7\